MNNTALIRPSQAWYWLAAPLFLAGIGLFVYTLFHGLMHITDSLTQVVVPGSVELNFKKGLTYTIFLEEQSVVDGKIYSTHESLNGLTCKVKSVSNDAFINLRRARGSMTYSIGSRSGRSVLEFTIPEDGAYQFACNYAEDSRGPEVVVAVGSGVGEKIFRTVMECIVAMFGGGGAATIAFVIIFFLRERAKKRALSLNPAQP